MSTESLKQEDTEKETDITNIELKVKADLLNKINKLLKQDTVTDVSECEANAKEDLLNNIKELLKQEDKEKETDIRNKESKLKGELLYTIKQLLKQEKEKETKEIAIQKCEVKVKDDITNNTNAIVNSPVISKQEYPMPTAPLLVMPKDGWESVPNDYTSTLFWSGLGPLYKVDQLLVHHKVHLLEVMIGVEANNKYIISDRHGQTVYHAVQNDDCCQRLCLAALSPFEMKIVDIFQNEVIHMERPCLMPCSCLLQALEVFAPPGTVVGSIKQEFSLYRPSFLIKDANGEIVLKIKGPVCTLAICGGDVNFDVYSKDEKIKVGKITKQWRGPVRQSYRDPDYFGVSFPMDLDVRIKAVLLGASFVIENLYFEKRTQNMPF